MKLPAFESFLKRKHRIAVVGLGYVGLPLAVHLSARFSVAGYDVKEGRINELKQGRDRTLEIPQEALRRAAIVFSADAGILSTCSIIIVAVPTPIDDSRIPDLNPLKNAAAAVGRHLTAGSTVVFESTVYPGVTEEICVPILERESGLKLGTGFTVGYSPERINPGDKFHTLDNITKVVSASDPETLALLSQIYGAIVKAGIFKVSGIKIAEAAKVIENTQRDINIALMNELAIIFNRMGIDTLEVLEAAGTKWNFLPFRPGLVGGHCIGVDPYYLTYKAESMGYHPEMILAGRRINDNMGKYIAERTIKIMINADIPVRNARVAVLGMTFKENIPDLRNTRVIDIITELKDYGVDVIVHDHMAEPAEVEHYYGLTITALQDIQGVSAAIVAVAHQDYHHLGLAGIAGLCCHDQPIIVDVKAIFAPEEARRLGIRLWRL
ncbi:MAG: nucleotide sugar dehydrogenase [Candidatus Omnitrophica bacterium]|nr:nucleotide sugar dehydrogenase [Candidatus Omnitrophota bacterium]